MGWVPVDGSTTNVALSGDPRQSDSVLPDASSRSDPTLLGAFVSDLTWRKAARGAEHRTLDQSQRSISTQGVLCHRSN